MRDAIRTTPVVALAYRDAIVVDRAEDGEGECRVGDLRVGELRVG